MGFRQLLDVVRSTHQRVVIKLLIPDLHHLKDDLSVFCPSCYAELSGWSCPAYVPVSQLIYAALRSKAKGLFPPSEECRRLGL